jgi:hypothetical protein
MPVETLCPQCQQRYRLNPALAAKKFRCLKCQNLFVPTPAPPTPPAPTASDETIAGMPPPQSGPETLQTKPPRPDDPGA